MDDQSQYNNELSNYVAKCILQNKFFEKVHLIIIKIVYLLILLFLININ